LVFDEQGQLINGTLSDYLLPTSTEVPMIEIFHHVTPSPYNELGVKGVGEAGAIPVGALFAQARAAMGSLLQLIGEGSDQQIATEPLRRSGAMQLPPGKPQFVRRPIRQFGNLPVHLGDIRIARSVGPGACSTGNGRGLARVLASRRIVNWRFHALGGSAMR